MRLFYHGRPEAFAQIFAEELPGRAQSRMSDIEVKTTAWKPILGGLEVLKAQSLVLGQTPATRYPSERFPSAVP